MDITIVLLLIGMLISCFSVGLLMIVWWICTIKWYLKSYMMWGITFFTTMVFSIVLNEFLRLLFAIHNLRYECETAVLVFLYWTLAVSALLFFVGTIRRETR